MHPVRSQALWESYPSRMCALEKPWGSGSLCLSPLCPRDRRGGVNRLQELSRPHPRARKDDPFPLQRTAQHSASRCR